MKQIQSYLLNTNRIKYLIFFLLLNIILMISFVIFNFLLGVEIAERKSNEINTLYFIKLVIIAPVVETMFFQFIPIEFTRLFTKNNKLIILITGIIFGVAHFFNDFLIRDLVITSLIGFLYTYLYIVTEKRKDLNSFIAVLFVHTFYNLFVFSLKSTVLIM